MRKILDEDLDEDDICYHRNVYLSEYPQKIKTSPLLVTLTFLES